MVLTHKDFEAIIRWKLSAPKFSKICAAGRATRERKIAVLHRRCASCSRGTRGNLAVLAGDADEIVARRAQDAILSQPIESFVEALKRERALPALFSYAGKNLADKPGVCDAMVQNKNCSAETSRSLVRHLSTLGISGADEELDRVSEISRAGRRS